jgi:hypothetical protein
MNNIVNEDIVYAKMDELRMALIQYEKVIQSFDFDSCYKLRGTMETNNIVEGNMHLVKSHLHKIKVRTNLIIINPIK